MSSPLSIWEKYRAKSSLELNSVSFKTSRGMEAKHHMFIYL